jgi:hypothetical protein
MASILHYALDGQGGPKIKAALENNTPRMMNDNNTPGHEKIGNLQYHHFVVNIPVGTEKFTVKLNGQTDDDLNLYVKRSGFAFADSDDLISAGNNSSAKETIVIANPQPGAWYIGIKGVNTVERTSKYWGWQYTGNTHLLNGIPYSIEAQWEIPKNANVEEK